MTPYDMRLCVLGEGPLWHPEREQLFWFDVHGHRLLSRDGPQELSWQFDASVSAAGWVDHDTLLVASDTQLVRFDIASGRSEPVTELEADLPETRSNDGRADPFGGFWIGTMGKRAEPGQGAVYRYYRGELRQLFDRLTIPNAIAFHPGGRMASFADTPARVIRRVELGPEGWPTAEPKDWIDLRAAGQNPDGAVFDAKGHLWVALWGAGRVARFGPDGARVDELTLPVPQPSCPAFGGDGLDQLFVTSAREDLDKDALLAAPDSGAVFTTRPGVAGLPEHQVIL